MTSARRTRPDTSRTRDGLLPLALWAVALALPGISGCHPPPPAVAAAPQVPEGEVWLTAGQIAHMNLRVEPLAEQPVDDAIEASGRVTFDDARVTHVFSPVTGRVIRIDAQLGQHLERGAPLLTVMSPDVGTASADLNKAQADLTAAEHDVRRQRDLFASHATTQANLEQSEDNHRKARAEMERARQKVRLLQSGSVDTVTQTYTARSPIAGSVIARGVNPGMEIQGQYSGGATLELFTIGDLDRVWVVADVYEVDFARVHGPTGPGQPGSHVTVSVVAYPNRSFEGNVDWISGTLDATTRTARVRCSLANPDGALRPEMYTTVNINVEARRALAIPRTALLRLGEQTVVFVEAGPAPDGRTRFVRAPVTVDEGRGGRWLPVMAGPPRGTRIVTAEGIQLVGLL